MDASDVSLVRIAQTLTMLPAAYTVDADDAVLTHLRAVAQRLALATSWDSASRHDRPPPEPGARA
ncbi:hypothetical protein ACIGEZ_32105 [Streptomyces sp. NPDC085481]|uniref:hypothetical protein n=1 Tax=Streptomyces sp. NPDC085481 TaxID=3365727 RepID=UPI0037CCFB47